VEIFVELYNAEVLSQGGIMEGSLGSRYGFKFPRKYLQMFDVLHTSKLK
jgi:hypothetical protein